MNVESYVDQIMTRFRELSSGTRIPRPKADPFVVKGRATRRNGRPALIYFVPNRSGGKAYEKGITDEEFEAAVRQLLDTGTLTRAWVKENLGDCIAEGWCNFTSIGGFLGIFGIARYKKSGCYEIKLGTKKQ